jgi:tRNA G18 (ribose-2'-O)-methylase SpoU
VCEHLGSRANLSSIVRLAGCFGLAELYLAGPTRVDPQIARDAARSVVLKRKRTLPSFLKKLRAGGARLVGLEQTTGSSSLFDYEFAARTVLVIGNERRGL